MSDAAESRLADQAPFAWPKRGGLPPLAWPFVVMAVIVGVASIVDLAAPLPGTSLGAWLSGALFALASILLILTPAALLRRVPRAHGTYPLLLVGLGLAALTVFVRPAVDLLRLGGGDVLAVVRLASVAGIVANLLVAGGLLRLRPRGATRPLVLLAIMALYALALAVPFLGAQLALDAVALLQSVGATLASALVMWVAISAWLDGDQPRRFWVTLSIAAALSLVSVGIQLAMSLLPSETIAALAPATFVAGSLLYAGSALATLAAYGRFAPRP